MANYTAIERYIKRLEKRLDEISPESDAILAKYFDASKKIGEGLEGLNYVLKNIDQIGIDVVRSLNEEELKVYNEGGALMSLLCKLQDENDFSAYKELEESFLRYNVPKETQIKIIFELLKRRELSYMEYCNNLIELKKLLPYPDALEQKLKQVTDGMAGTTALEKERFIDLLRPLINEPELENTIEIQKEAFKTINSFHINGKVVAHEAPILFKLAINKFGGPSLTDKQIDLIMSESRRLYIAKLQAEEAEYLTDLRREEREIEQYESFKKSQVDNKKRRIALQELKKFLKDDMPIKFLTTEELTEIERLLAIACYSQSAIEKIKRNILENNQKILEIEKHRQIEMMANIYLTDIDRELLDSARMILATEDKHPLLDKLKEDISFIEIELINLYGEDEDNTDTLELINLWLDELRGHLAEYKCSNYRLCMIKPE